MSDAKDPKLKLFELYLATAEKVSDPRTQARHLTDQNGVALVVIRGDGAGLGGAPEGRL